MAAISSALVTCSDTSELPVLTFPSIVLAATPKIIAALRKKEKDKNKGQFGIEGLLEKLMYKSKNSSSEGMPSSSRFWLSKPYL